jgi:hypothetical protein
MLNENTMHQQKRKFHSIEFQEAVHSNYKRGVRGYGYKALAQKYGVSKSEVENLIKYTPQSQFSENFEESRGCGPLIKRSDVSAVKHWLDIQPTLTDQEIAERLHSLLSNKIEQAIKDSVTVGHGNTDK